MTQEKGRVLLEFTEVTNPFLLDSLQGFYLSELPGLFFRPEFLVNQMRQMVHVELKRTVPVVPAFDVVPLNLDEVD